MSLSEIEFLLTDSGETLDFIKKSYEQSLAGEDDASIALKLKIKHFLENMKSSLDYVGYDVFSQFCSGAIKAKFEDHVRNLYFPNKRSENEFKTYIENMYPGLKDCHPEIIHIFRSVQPFTKTQWFIDLNELVNKNKHRNLTKQTRKEVASHVHHMETSDGSSYTNMFYANCDNSIIVNNIPFNSPNNPFVKNFDATFYTDLFFKDLGRPAIPILTEIYEGVGIVFDRVKQYLQEAK